MTPDSGDQIDRGPNGFPYLDNGGTSVSRWESGDYHLKVTRSDGEHVSANMKEEQLIALEKSIRRVRGENDE